MSECCSQRCPACREPLAPKNLEATCGSCGHKFALPSGGKAPKRFACGMGLLLLAFLLSGAALESDRIERARLELRNQEALQRALRGSEELAHKLKIASCRADCVANYNRELREQLQNEKTRNRALTSTYPHPTEPVAAPVTTDLKSDLEQGELKADIHFLEDVVARDPTNAEAHFRLSLAYDRCTSDPSWSAKSFEHAKKAIKLDPSYKKKFQPMIRNSRIAKKVAGIIHEIIQKSEDSALPDEEAAGYAEEIGRVLGDNGVRLELPGQQGETGPTALKQMLQDPEQRRKLRDYWDASTRSGGEGSLPGNE